MDAAKMNQAIRIAKLYYELHYNQLEIAAREGISKSSVSRILKNAMDMGIIEVRIKDSVLANGNLENELIARFPIKRAIIVPDLVGNSQILMQDVCAALAEDLPRYIKNDSVIGVTWGHALAVLAQQLPKIKRSGVSVIQLTGGFSRAIFESGALDVLKRFVDSVGGTGYQIPAPAMVAESSIVEALKKDPQSHEILEMAEVCQTAIYSVGNLERPSIVYEMGLIDENDYKDFSRRGAVGDCCSHFIKQNGELFDKKIDARVVGASLETIKKIPNKLVVAVGKEKEKIITAALQGGLVDSLYIDEPTELYRQHSSNVLGARTLRKRMKNWVRPHILFAKYWSLIKASQDQARNLLELPLSSQNKEIIENFVTIMDAPFRERLARIRKYGYRKNRAFHTTVFTTLILTKFAYRGEKDVRLF